VNHFGLGPGEISKSLVADGIGNPVDGSELGCCRGSEEQPEDPPVSGIGAPLDHPGAGELVDEAGQSDRLHLEDFGEIDLPDALLPRDMNESP